MGLLWNFYGIFMELSEFHEILMGSYVHLDFLIVMRFSWDFQIFMRL